MKAWQQESPWFMWTPLNYSLCVNQSSKKGQIGRPRLAQQTRAARPKFCKGCRCRLQAAYQQPLAAIANDGGGKAHIDQESKNRFKGQPSYEHALC